MNARLLGALVLVGCGGGGAAVVAPPAPVPTRAIHPGDLDGAWAGTDAGGWRYALTLGPANAFRQRIDRGARGACEQVGTLAQDDYEGLTVDFEENTCNEEFVGWQLRVRFGEYTGEAMTMVLGGDGSAMETRRYQRPVPPPPAATVK